LRVDAIQGAPETETDSIGAPVLKSWAISRTRRWKGSLRIRSSVLQRRALC
jgi:hypothetical protein